MKPPKPQVYPTGMLRWDLPNSKLYVLWAGPGSSLMLVMGDGITMTSILFDGYAKQFDTKKAAKAAFAEFFSRKG